MVCLLQPTIWFEFELIVETYKFICFWLLTSSKIGQLLNFLVQLFFFWDCMNWGCVFSVFNSHCSSLLPTCLQLAHFPIFHTVADMSLSHKRVVMCAHSLLARKIFPEREVPVANRRISPTVGGKCAFDRMRLVRDTTAIAPPWFHTILVRWPMRWRFSTETLERGRSCLICCCSQLN